MTGVQTCALPISKPVILVPSPNVAEDHQTKNALALVKKDAAVMIADANAREEMITRALKLVFDDKKLMDLSKNILTLAEQNSAERIADEVEKIIK